MKNKLFSVSEQQALEEIMLLRRDVRGNNFIKTDVSEDLIERLLYAALQAPSVGFSQPWEFVIIRDDSTKNKIANCFKTENLKAETEFDSSRRSQYTQLKLEGILEAPVNMAVYYKPSPTPVLGQTSMAKMGEYSVVCAIQNMWLMARALNIGMGWVSILDPFVVDNILKAPANNKLIAYLCIGHVKEFLEKPELEVLQWDKRKELASVVYCESYS